MRYDIVRDKIKTGDVLLCRGQWICSKLVRLITWEDVSHVGIACWLSFNGAIEPRLCMFEAVEGRDVRIVPLYKTMIEQYWPNGGKIFWQPITDPNVHGKGIVDFCLDKWGDGYASKFQFILGLSPTLKRFRRWAGRNFDSNMKLWHCSELVTNAFIYEGYKHDKDPAITSPGDVGRFSCLGERVELEYCIRREFV